MSLLHGSPRNKIGAAAVTQPSPIFTVNAICDDSHFIKPVRSRYLTNIYSEETWMLEASK